MNNRGFTKRIDLVQMKDKIENKAKQILAEINDENLKYFANEVKMMADFVFVKYISEVYDLYTSGDMAITDINKLATFTDTDNGFQHNMLLWKNQNGVSFTNEKIELPDAPTVPNTKSHHKTTIGIGTVIAGGFVVMKHPWIALAIELLALSASYVQYKRKNVDEKKYRSELEKYNSEITKLKATFVDSIIIDIEKWLLQGQEKTKEVLTSYGLL